MRREEQETATWSLSEVGRVQLQSSEPLRKLQSPALRRAEEQKSRRAEEQKSRRPNFGVDSENGRRVSP